METKMILNPSLYVFMLEVQEQIHNGWEIDLNYPPTMFGTCYEVGMIKKDKQTIADLFPASQGPAIVNGTELSEGELNYLNDIADIDISGAFVSTTEPNVQSLTAPVYKSYEKAPESPDKRKAGRPKTKP